MRLCIGEPLTTPDWAGLPMGRFRPPVTQGAVPVAAVQDTLFVWCDGASPAQVRARRDLRHYRRHDGVLDLMSMDEEVWISHDVEDAPGECLLVAVAPEFREHWSHEARSLTRAPLRPFYGCGDGHLHALARALEGQCLNSEPLGRLYTESLSVALSAYVEARYSEGADYAAAGRYVRLANRLSSHRRRMIFEYIEDRLQENLSLRELATLANCSPQHFVRLFKKTFAQSPHQYLIDRRIQRAKLLLSHGSVTLAEVAHRCGFADQSHFTRTFVKRTGQTPRVYQRSKINQCAVSEHLWTS